MIQKLLIGVAGVAWFGLIFFLGLRMTFPSEEAGQFLQYQVQEQTRGRFLLKLSDLRPWGVGVSANNVVLTQVKGTRQNPEQVPLLVADALSVRAYPFSLLGSSPSGTGTLQVGAGSVDFDATVLRTDDAMLLSSARVQAESFPVAEIGALMGGAVDGVGGIDLDIDVSAEDGTPKTANGDVDIEGRDLQITKLDLSSMGVPNLGMEFPVEELEFDIEIREGKAHIKKGWVRSSYAGTLDIEGDITLREQFDRSSLRLEGKVVLGEGVAMFESMLESMLGDDGKFSCTGVVAAPSCSGSGRSRGRRTVSRGRRGSDTRAEPSPSPTPRPAATLSDDEREKLREERARRREEMRDRLRTARPDGGMAPRRPGTPTGTETEDDFDEAEYEDEPLDDEELLDDNEAALDEGEEDF